MHIVKIFLICLIVDIVIVACIIGGLRLKFESLCWG